CYGAGDTTGIELLRTPYRAPLANAVCERFLGTLRRECLDHVIIISERQLWRALREYVAYFNSARPHQGVGHQLPDNVSALVPAPGAGHIVALPVLDGWHHDYRRAA
ncbi:MAG: Integrase catalytic region, partial [Chloroflexi bacterium]|nr:Integrase catalytic region [Chloroflexota bacterium]